MIHIRLESQNTGKVLCGSSNPMLSQSLLGLNLQGTVYDRFPFPKREDYCPECIQVLNDAAPAIEALNHLGIPSRLIESIAAQAAEGGDR